MSYQTRLMLVQLILILILVISLGFGFYFSSTKALQDNAESNLNVLADKMSQQMDNLVQPMDFISLNLLSDGTFMSSMKTLVMLDRQNIDNLRFINDAFYEIYRALMNYTLSRDFYRVSMFNSVGDFKSSNIETSFANENIQSIINGLGWTEKVRNSNGKIAVIQPYNDPWDDQNNVKVFGVARTVRGTDFNIGYIEVQQRYQELENIFTVDADFHMSVLAFTREGEVLFNKGVNDQLVSYYHQIADQGSREAKNLSDPINGSENIVAVTVSEYTGIRTVLTQNKTALLRPLSAIRMTTILTSLFVILISFVYLKIFSRHLTRPITRLKREMELTRFDNLPHPINLSSSSNNEIEALNNAFLQLRERLHDSLDREVTSHNLHLQASFESLQARVNPHFIYNILNVISNRGLLNNDPVICKICTSIASMLRYSTATADLFATMADEIDHVGNYLNLMKIRYEHRLDYTVEVEAVLMNVRLPKMVLQPLVENSFNHGYVTIDKDRLISIRGFLQDQHWIIEIKDNGQGFDAEIMERLHTRIRQSRELGIVAETGHGVNGMGVLNVYSRLELLYHDHDFKFILANHADGGACITISALIGTDEGVNNGT